MLYAIMAILGITYAITWNKYYINHVTQKKPTSFQGYITWLKENIQDLIGNRSN